MTTAGERLRREEGFFYRLNVGAEAQPVAVASSEGLGVAANHNRSLRSGAAVPRAPTVVLDYQDLERFAINSVDERVGEDAHREAPDCEENQSPAVLRAGHPCV